MAQDAWIVQKAQPLNDENIPHGPGSSTTATERSSNNETTEAGNTKTWESSGHKRKASSSAADSSTPRKKARHDGCVAAKTTSRPPVSKLNRASRDDADVANASARRDDDRLDQDSSPAQHLTDEHGTGESARDQDGPAAECPILPGQAPRTRSPAHVTNGTRKIIAPLSPASRTGQLLPQQAVTGLESLGNGLVVDRGSGADLGPPGHDQAWCRKTAASRGPSRIVEETVAAPRPALPRVLPPLPNGRHPLPTAPVRKGKDTRDEKEDKKDCEKDRHGE